MNMDKTKSAAKHLIAYAAYLFGSNMDKKGDLSVKILMHHRIAPGNAVGTALPWQVFEDEIAFLSKHYIIISFDEAVEKLAANNEQGEYIVITFDDGYLDNLETALPILEKYDAPATVFITTDGLDDGILHWDMLDASILNTTVTELSLEQYDAGTYDLSGLRQRHAAIRTLHRMLKKRSDTACREIIAHIVDELGHHDSLLMLDERGLVRLADSPLITIGAHTLTHPILSQVDHEQGRREIFECKRRLEDILGKPVRYFAYPNGGRGDYTQESVRLVKEAGYVAACTTIAGDNGAGADFFQLRRLDAAMDFMTNPGREGRFCHVLFRAHLSGLFEKLKRLMPT